MIFDLLVFSELCFFRAVDSWVMVVGLVGLVGLLVMLVVFLLVLAGLLVVSLLVMLVGPLAGLLMGLLLGLLVGLLVLVGLVGLVILWACVLSFVRDVKLLSVVLLIIAGPWALPALSKAPVESLPVMFFGAMPSWDFRSMGGSVVLYTWNFTFL